MKLSANAVYKNWATILYSINRQELKQIEKMTSPSGTEYEDFDDDNNDNHDAG